MNTHFVHESERETFNTRPIEDKQAEEIKQLKKLLNRAYGYVVGDPCGYAMGLPTEILEALKESEDK